MSTSAPRARGTPICCSRSRTRPSTAVPALDDLIAQRGPPPRRSSACCPAAGRTARVHDQPGRALAKAGARGRRPVHRHVADRGWGRICFESKPDMESALDEAGDALPSGSARPRESHRPRRGHGEALRFYDWPARRRGRVGSPIDVMQEALAIAERERQRGGRGGCCGMKLTSLLAEEQHRSAMLAHPCRSGRGLASPAAPDDHRRLRAQMHGQVGEQHAQPLVVVHVERQHLPLASTPAACRGRARGRPEVPLQVADQVICLCDSRRSGATSPG